MAGHPQGSNRGVLARTLIQVNATTDTIQGNSTAVIVSKKLRVGSYTTGVISSNSTGVLVGSKYIKTNTTGN